MGREKKNVPRAVSGDHAKDRHKRNRKGNLVDWTAPLPPGLVARPDRPRISSKHKSWFEFIENKDKKKKLEFEFTEKREPPPGFEFVPIGNPALTTACKELSREQGAMIFIVTSSQGQFSKRLSFHLNRVGHHIRQTVVEQARVSLGDKQVAAAAGAQPGQPEPIPERQADIDKQADAAIRDLFPRIPNTDREMIIEHSFSKDHSLTAKLQSRLNKGDPPVGLAPQLTLSRRVQLAVLAHIRHNHTRYDQLLRETSYINARKAVESLCLDILVKWRGDEETGRDQLDEILCEVIVISDSESDESDEDEEEVGSSPDTSSSAEDRVEGAPREDVPSRAAPPPVDPSSVSLGSNNLRGDGLLRANNAPQKVRKTFREARKAAKWAQRGFSRYQAALNQAWDQAVERRRLGNGGPMQPVGPVTVDRPVTHGPQPWRTAESGHPTDGLAIVRDPAGPPYPVQSRFHAASLPSVDVRYERASRVDELQQTTFPTNCRMLPEARAQGSGPAAAPRLLHGAPEVQRVSHDGRDLKDYPVPSIEPLSSEPSSFSPRFPLSYRLSEPGVTPSLEAPVGVQAHSYGRLAWTTETTAAPGFRSIYAEEGFARLPPHASPRPTSIVAEPRQEEFILLSSRPVSTARASALTATSGGPDQQHSSSVYGVAASRGDRPIPQSAPRPVWIGDDGVILRSESRPIIIQDRPVLLETNSAFVSSENRRLSPVRWTSDAQNAGASWTEEHDGRHIDSRNDQRLETLPGEFVEIVRVSNKFPRRHEPHPTPAGAGRYDLQSAAPQRSTSQPVYDGPTRYDLRRLPTQAQWVQQPAGTVEQPVFHQGNAAFGARQPEAYKSETRRQERVIGIEYVQARPSLEARAYSDRGPLYDSGEPAYRPRSTSTMPTASAGFVHQPYHPVSGTDEDLMRD